MKTTKTQAIIWYLTGSMSPRTVADIAERFNCSKSTVYRAIDKMQIQWAWQPKRTNSRVFVKMLFPTSWDAQECYEWLSMRNRGKKTRAYVHNPRGFLL